MGIGALLVIAAVAATAMAAVTVLESMRKIPDGFGRAGGVAATSSLPTRRSATVAPPPPGTSPTPSTSRNKTASFPPVRPAADLPSESVGHLGTDVTLETSSLRWVVLDMFDEPIYHCLFSLNLHNLTEGPVEVTTGFRMIGDPKAEWGGGSPTAMEPGESQERVVGWEGLSPDEVGVSESDCKGPVELTVLEVRPG